ncbi:WD40/YVTN/BNR-like repeat-containing protein [Sphingomonas glaciei]|uniref:Sortilin N-terminal domain-containing protein n=1 Tax=Sphingomonas glaciei TaxID=2938948 RepID=A0ABY5MR72_9SPHN|nr:hypothetical protein [Sphingomonas glaciei]UUR06969.1 hypothetical protein M1K48_08360 [Sphingomonas glaciei]
MEQARKICEPFEGIEFNANAVVCDKAFTAGSSSEGELLETWAPGEQRLDRRTALKGLVAATGAGATFGCRNDVLGATNIASPDNAAIAQPSLRLPKTADFKSVTQAQVPIGAGGFVSGIDMSADGDLVACRTDVTNAYLRRRSDRHWAPLFAPETMQKRDYDPLPDYGDKADGIGVAGIRIAPSDKNIIYASFCGYLWKSKDGGRTVLRTGLKQLKMLANSGVQRLYNRTIDVHPTDPNIIVVGSWGEGAWISLDGGDRWKQLTLPASLPSGDGHPGIYLVAFDPTRSGRLNIFVTGRGLYRCDDVRTGEFRLIPAGPTFCTSLVSAANGNTYVCEKTGPGQGGRLWQYSRTGWSVALTEREGQAFAYHPDCSGKAVLIDPNGFFMISLDHGKSFTSVGDGQWTASGSEIPWMGGLSLMFPAEVLFDPLEVDRLLVAQGVGVASVKTKGSRFPVRDWSAGIEELCAVSAVCVPGGKTYLSAFDKSFWRVDSFAGYANDFRYPLPAGRKHDASLVAFASYMDYVKSDPNFLVGVIAPAADSAPGYTDNGGESWHSFANAPESGWGVGGCIAASTKENIILLPSNRGVGVFTVDGGKRWEPVKLDGATPTAGFSDAFYIFRKSLAADKERPGTFAIVYTTLKNDLCVEPKGGLWVTRDGGRSWSQVFKGVIGEGKCAPTSMINAGIDPRQFWQCQLEYVPGRPGELVYTPYSDARSDRFYWSSNGGATWDQLHRSIRNVRTFGFGRALERQERPALFFWGQVKGVEGLYASYDWFSSEPRLITRHPSPMLGKVTCIAGDPDRPGRLIVGTSCAGWVRFELEL